jgi:hypothetical protein
VLPFKGGVLKGVDVLSNSFLSQACDPASPFTLPALPCPAPCPAPPAGLPEEVRISHTALGRGYVLVAISSGDRRGSRCWSLPRRPDEHSDDTRSVSGTAASPIMVKEEMSFLAAKAASAEPAAGAIQASCGVVPGAPCCSALDVCGRLWCFVLADVS